MDLHSVALAIYGDLIADDRREAEGPAKPDDVANLAYAYAEAFMRARSKRSGEASVQPLRL